MAFVFNANDFAQPEPSPGQQLGAAFFGSADTALKQAFKDKQENDRFQQELGLRMKQFDWQKHQAEQELQRQQQEQNNMATVVAGQLPDTAPKVVPGNLPATAAYLAQHNARLSVMQKLLAGMKPEHQQALSAWMQANEQKHKTDAFRKDTADLIGGQIRQLQMSGPQGPTESGAPVSTDPQLDMLKQQHAMNLQAWQKMLQDGVGDPEKILPLLSQGQQAIQQMQQQHGRAQFQAQSYQALHEQTGQRISELMAQEQASPGSVNKAYLFHLQDRYNEEEGLISNRLSNLDLDQRQFSEDWDKMNKSWWGNVTTNQGNKDVEEAFKHVQAQRADLDRRMAHLGTAMQSGLIDEKAAKAQYAQFQSQYADLDSAEQQLMQMGSQPQGSPEQPPGGIGPMMGQVQQPTQTGAPKADPTQIAGQAEDDIAQAVFESGGKLTPGQAAQQLKLPEQLIPYVKQENVRAKIQALVDQNQDVPGVKGLATDVADQAQNIASVKQELTTLLGKGAKIATSPGLSPERAAPNNQVEYRRLYMQLQKQLEDMPNERVTGLKMRAGLPVDAAQQVERSRITQALAKLKQLATYQGWSTPTIKEMAGGD